MRIEIDADKRTAKSKCFGFILSFTLFKHSIFRIAAKESKWMGLEVQQTVSEQWKVMLKQKQNA